MEVHMADMEALCHPTVLMAPLMEGMEALAVRMEAMEVTAEAMEVRMVDMEVMVVMEVTIVMEDMAARCLWDLEKEGIFKELSLKYPNLDKSLKAFRCFQDY